MTMPLSAQNAEGTGYSARDTNGYSSVDWEYEITCQRGREVVIRAIPAVSMLRFRDAYFGLGGGYNSVCYISEAPSQQEDW